MVCLPSSSYSMNQRTNEGMLPAAIRSTHGPVRITVRQRKPRFHLSSHLRESLLWLMDHGGF